MLSGKEGGGGQFARNDLNLMYLLINLLEFLKFFCFFLWWEGGGGGGGGGGLLSHACVRNYSQN
jgi:hypothetical protein